MSPSIPDCLIRYEGHGLSFEYPDVWELSEESDGEDIQILVSADESCFWLMRVMSSGPRPSEVLESCRSAFDEEYEDAEFEDQQCILAGMPAGGQEVHFSCHELLNTAMLECVRTLEMTLLVWWQVTDHELPDVRPHFERMSRSVRILSLDN
jgi:hypothetical protein